MIVEMLTTCHTQYTSDSSKCIFLFNRTTLQVSVTNRRVFYMCTICDSTNINTIIKFIPDCLQHVSCDGLNGGSDSYRQFRDICGKRRNINLIIDVTPLKEITWGCIWSVLCMTPTIILNNPVFILSFTVDNILCLCLVTGKV